MQSEDIHDKIIGIDMFIAMGHQNSNLILDILLINNRIRYEWMKEVDDEKTLITNTTFDKIVDMYETFLSSGIDNITKTLDNLRNK